MQYAVLFILIVYAMIKPSSKLSAILLIAFGTMLCAFCTESYDLGNYKYMFDNIDSYREKMAFGWDLIFGLAAKSGMSFTCYKALCGLFTLTVVYMASSRLTANSSMVMALYCICLLSSQITQIRNFMAMAVMYYGVTYLIKDKTNPVLKYLFFLFFAISLHYSMLFYIVFIFARIKIPSGRYFNIIVALLMIELCVLYSNFAYNVLKGFPALYRVSQYLDFLGGLRALNVHSIKTVLIAAGLHIITFFVCSAIYRYNKIDTMSINKGLNADGKNDILTINQLKMIYRMQMLCLLILPLYVGSFSYLRMFLITIPLIFAMAGNTVSIAKSTRNGFCRKYCRRVEYMGIACGVLVFLALSIIYGEWFTTLNSFSFI